ncbi:N-acyl homoserine lactonase family protein, partial [Thermodesulfobacteriota bacterium]
MEYRIFPLPLTETESVRGLGYFRDFSGVKRTSIIYSWFIQGGKNRILIDPGIDAKDVSRFSSAGLEGKKLASVEEALSRFYLKPADIDIVILTHLHYDHFANTHKCKNARILVQKKELDFALNPHPLFAGSFKKDWFQEINFEVIDGDEEIAPGIQVLLTPGHTAGNQSVMIQTTQGKAVIPGFCATLEHFFPERFTKTG